MKLSLLAAITLSSTNVVDTTDTFDPTVHRNYPADCLIQFGDYIWQNVGELLIIPTYNNTVKYSIGDIVFNTTNNRLEKVVDFATSLQPKQPEDYSAVDTSRDSSVWSHRYVKLTDTFSDGFTYTVGSYEHLFTDYRDPPYSQIEDRVTPPTSDEAVWRYEGWAYPEVTNDIYESQAEVKSEGDYGFFTYIYRGDVLYARTHIDAPIEYDVITGDDPIFKPVTTIQDLETFAKVRPNKVIAPFDEKHYSKADRDGSMEYIVNVNSGKFDTLGLGRVTAEKADVYFYDAPDGNGNLVDSILDYTIDTSRDNLGLLPEYQTTTVIYSDTVVNAGGSIRFVLTGNHIFLGTIMAGLKIDAGFTNLQFSNSFIDHSPKNVDNWGNVDYIEGVKVNVFDGSVDIPITTYDRMTRLMGSIGGSTVILNGSDSVDNTPPDSEDIFASTMLIGRMSNFKLQTKLKDKRMGDIATYSIRIVELT